MSARGSTIDEAGLLRDHGDAIRRLESLTFLKGTVGVGSLRIGGFVLEVEPGGDLQVRRLSDDTVTLLMAG